MDKYEYKLKLEEIKNLIEAKDYKGAAEIADGINWKKVKSVSTLCMVGELYEKLRRLEESREILLMAYDRSPVGRNIIYRLALVAIRMGSLDEAQEYYEEFIEIAPHDNMKYVLKYELAKAKGQGLEEQISILEEFKDREYTEEWAFELAYLYHKSGKSEKCVDICDELILWFGEGKYVEKALELKMIYQPLNKLQEDKYRRFKQRHDGVVEVSPRDMLMSGEIVQDTIKIPSVLSDTGKFNTVNLQEELAKSMQQIMDATEPETVSETMNNIKKMVGDVSYMYATRQGQTVPDKKIQPEVRQSEELQPEGLQKEPMQEGVSEPALEIDFKGILSEEYDGQISMKVPDTPTPALQITGQMSIEDILAEWERAQEAHRQAIAEAEQRELENAKIKALREAENIMEHLAETMPELGNESWIFEQPAKPGPKAAEERNAAGPEPLMESLAELIEQAKSIEPAKQAGVAEAVAEEAAEMVSKEIMPEEIIPEEIVPEEELKSEIQRHQEELEKRILEQQQHAQQILEREIRKEQIAKREISVEVATAEDPPITKMNEEQKKIFTYFTLIGGMEQQLCQALEGVKQRKKNNPTSEAGNLMIIGGRGSGKTELAKNFIVAYQKLIGQTKCKVGQLPAAELNQKDIESVIHRMESGYLIIEKAGNLSKESVLKLSKLMEQNTQGLMIILEDDREGIEKALSRDVGFAKKFTEKVHIPVFTNDELVAFAKSYARENDCEIEDMGILALYNSISNIQRLEEPTTLTEIIEIMDDAIYSASRGGLKKLFGGKKSTEEGLVLIREKDFKE